jgi:hypothetical protein
VTERHRLKLQWQTVSPTCGAHAAAAVAAVTAAAVAVVAAASNDQGAAEGREPLLQRGRYCVALKRSRRSAVSKGSVKLGQSGTGEAASPETEPQC